ncbi:hypothetical protein IG631_23383 [Alternaria alternata]|nr:hypothetical protein IG631_23383 [Alternaria alternata]
MLTASDKATEDGTPWDRRLVARERIGRIAPHNEQDSEERLGEDRIHTAPISSPPHLWESMENIPESTNDNLETFTRENVDDEEDGLETPEPTSLSVDIDAILLIGYLYATKSGLRAGSVLALTKSNAVRLLQCVSFSTLTKCQNMEEQVKYVLDGEVYAEALRLNDQRGSKPRLVYRGFPVDEWVIRSKSDRRLLENGEDLPLGKCSSLMQDRVQLFSLYFAYSFKFVTFAEMASSSGLSQPTFALRISSQMLCSIRKFGGLPMFRATTVHIYGASLLLFCGADSYRILPLLSADFWGVFPLPLQVCPSRSLQVDDVMPQVTQRILSLTGSDEVEDQPRPRQKPSALLDRLTIRKPWASIRKLHLSIVTYEDTLLDFLAILKSTLRILRFSEIHLVSRGTRHSSRDSALHSIGAQPQLDDLRLFRLHDEVKQDSGLGWRVRSLFDPTCGPWRKNRGSYRAFYKDVVRRILRAEGQIALEPAVFQP